MHAPQSLVQAALQRLAARIGSGLIDGAAGLAVLAQEAPERLRQEITLFWQEVEAEAERLERGQAGAGAAAGSGFGSGSGFGFGSAAAPPPGDAQERIDALRARVAELASRLESLPLRDRA